MESAELERFGDRLTRLGLTKYEARAYLALLARDSFTAAQVSRHAALPRQRIYDVLGTLVQKGLAAERPGAVVKYAAVAPELAIDRLLAIRRHTLADLERDGAEMVERLEPIYHAGKRHTDPLEYIEVLRDRGAINERFRELQAAVKEEILVFNKPPYATPPQENVEGLELLKRHSARGIYELSLFDDPDAAAGVRRFADAGEKARVVDTLPLKLVIIDEEVVMFGMEDPVERRDSTGSDLTIVVVEHPALANVLKAAFEATWERGLSLADAERRHAELRKQSA
jgi:sugar-specific transcriptional regulator TrmB